MGKVSREILEKYYETGYIVSIACNDSFVYTDFFYLDLYRKLEEGLSDVKAYEALGFNTKEIGVDRAYSACRYARKLAKDKAFKVKASNYDGGIKRNDLDKLSPEEELAYLRARNQFLETVVEVQKKTSDLLEMRKSFSKEENQ
jgi:hypothetical protein